MASIFWDQSPATPDALLARHLPAQEEPYVLPRPIIMDTDLRLTTRCKLLQNFQQNRGRRPWVVCSDVYSPMKSHRKQELETAGARIIEVTQGLDGMYFITSSAYHFNHYQGLSIDSLLTTLNDLGIRSLMVEGGQRVISSFISHLDAETKHVVDILIVTVAPTFVGVAGVGAFSQGLNSVRRFTGCQ